MISSVKVAGINYEVDEPTKKYITKRIGHLDRYLPRHARKTAVAVVTIQEVNHDHGNKYEAEINLDIPGKLLNAKDSTVNVFAAVDIVEAKIKAQISEYKYSHVPHIGRHRLLSRFKKSFQREL